MTTINLGPTIRGVRTDLGFTRVTLSEETGLSVSHISMMERGERNPTLKTLAVLCAAFEISVSDLIHLAEMAGRA
jgi:transcriptional regulator with XRE-family HTH domain